MSYSILKNSNDIKKVFSSKKTLSNKILRIKICPCPREGVRVVFAMSKKLAHKPMRNKQIRRMKVIAAITSKYVHSCDMAIIIRISGSSFDELKAAYESLLVRIKE